MDPLAARPNRFPYPPIIYGLAILAGAFSPWFLPVMWPGHPLADLLAAVGGVLIGAAIFLDIKAMLTLSQHKTTILPMKGADHLVTSGPYSLSRNPIYLGNTMMTIGAGFAFGIFWFIPLAFFAAFLTQKLAIEREERHLAAKFGKHWRDYTHKVRRWF